MGRGCASSPPLAATAGTGQNFFSISPALRTRIAGVPPVWRVVRRQNLRPTDRKTHHHPRTGLRTGITGNHTDQPCIRAMTFNSSVCRLLWVAMHPSAAIGATLKHASNDSPKVNGAAITQAAPVRTQVTPIQVSALLPTCIARAICSSVVPALCGVGVIESVSVIAREVATSLC